MSTSKVFFTFTRSFLKMKASADSPIQTALDTHLERASRATSSLPDPGPPGSLAWISYSFFCCLCPAALCGRDSCSTTLGPETGTEHLMKELSETRNYTICYLLILILFYYFLICLLLLIIYISLRFIHIIISYTKNISIFYALPTEPRGCQIFATNDCNIRPGPDRCRVVDGT